MLVCSIELHRIWSRQRLSRHRAALTVYCMSGFILGILVSQVSNALHNISDREEQTKGICVLEVSMTSYKQSNKSLWINEWGKRAPAQSHLSKSTCSSLEPVVLSKHKHPLISLICTSALGIYQITQQGRGAFVYFFILLFTRFLFGNQAM